MKPTARDPKKAAAERFRLPPGFNPDTWDPDDYAEADLEAFAPESTWQRLQIFLGWTDEPEYRSAYPLIFAFSFLSQVVGLATAVYLTPPPVPLTFAEMVQDRFVQAMIAENKTDEPKPEPVEEKKEEEPEPVDELAEQLPAAEPEPEAAPELPVELPPEEPVEEEPEELAQQDAGTGEGGDGGDGGSGFQGIGGGGDGPALNTGGNGRGNGGGNGAPRAERREERQEERTAERENERRVVRLEDTAKGPQVRARTASLEMPRELRDRGVFGRVVVQCLITDRGEVRACRHRSGPEELAAFVISRVTQWEFEPALDNTGKPVVAPFTFNVPFRQT